MKSIQVFVLTLLLVAASSSIAQVSETRELGFFDNIVFKGSGKIYLYQGNSPSIKIDIDNPKRVGLDEIRTEISGRTLNVYFEEKAYKSSLTDIDYHITYPELAELSIKGAANVKTVDPIVAEDFSLYVGGADKSELELDVVSLNVHIAGAGHTRLLGKANVQHFQMDGAGSIHAKELEGNIVHAVLNGVGSMRVHAKEVLDAKVNGVGSITYSGDPGRKEFKKGGLGSIKPES